MLTQEQRQHYKEEKKRLEKDFLKDREVLYQGLLKVAQLITSHIISAHPSDADWPQELGQILVRPVPRHAHVLQREQTR